MPGYHLNTIAKGQIGHFSKVVEEFEEFCDAQAQDCKIMALVELSDLIGSIEHYYKAQSKDWGALIENTGKTLQARYIDAADLKENFSILNANPTNWSQFELFIWEIHQYLKIHNLELGDLLAMSHITQRAFTSGQRS